MKDLLHKILFPKYHDSRKAAIERSRKFHSKVFAYMEKSPYWEVRKAAKDIFDSF